MTTMTRRLFRPHTDSPLLEMMHAERKSVNAGGTMPVQALFDVTYLAEPSPFELVEAHVELGGEAIGMRGGVMYTLFAQQDGPAWPELWPGCVYHMVIEKRMVWPNSVGNNNWREWNEANPCSA